MSPLREQDQEPCAAVGVRIAVHGDVLALAHSAIYQAQQLAGAARMGDPTVEVGKMTGDFSPLPDVQCLSYRVQEAVSKGISQMGVVMPPSRAASRASSTNSAVSA